MFSSQGISVYQSRFPRAVLYCPIIKVDFAALATSTRFSPRTSIWDELTDEKFNNNFVILYTKPMLQITGYIIQTTYLSRIPNPSMFCTDHGNDVFLSVCFNVFQSSQKASIEYLEQVTSLRTILWPSNIGECKTMMPSILQYYLEFANLFWNHPTLSTLKKSNFLVDCLDSFWMTASIPSILQTACCDFIIPLVHEHLTIDPALSEQLLPSWDSK